MHDHNRLQWGIQVSELDWAPGSWDAWLLPFADGGDGLFVDTLGSKLAASAAAKAELRRLEARVANTA